MRRSDVSQVTLREHWWTWGFNLLDAVLAAAVIIGAITLGATRQIFSLRTQSIFGRNVDADLQLAFIGVINKIQDLLVTKAFTSLAGVLLTLKMTTFRSGATLLDFDLADELTKPWCSLWAFWKRKNTFGWRRASWLRLLITSATSVCVLLQGLAINTMGIPKERWIPDNDTEIVQQTRHPIPSFEGVGVDWYNYHAVGVGMLGDHYASWSVADALIAGSSLTNLQRFNGQMSFHPYGWHDLSVDSTDRAFALDTRYTGSSSRGIAAQVKPALAINQYLALHGLGHANRSNAFTGPLNLDLPSTLVSCESFSGIAALGTMVVDEAWNDPDSVNSFHISMLPLSQQNFPGASCKVSVQRVRYPLSVWYLIEPGSISINDYRNDYHKEISVLPTEPVDLRMASMLGRQANATLVRLEALSQDTTAAGLFLGMARQMRKNRTEFLNDTEALAPVLAVFASQLIAQATWNTTLSEQYSTLSPVRWQLYGSGPRLPWEWAASTILGILLLALLGGLSMDLWYRITPGEWLKPAGMLLAANLSPRMRDLERLVKGDEEKLHRLRFAVRKDTASSAKNTVQLVDSVPRAQKINRAESYDWTK